MPYLIVLRPTHFPPILEVWPMEIKYLMDSFPNFTHTKVKSAGFGLSAAKKGYNDVLDLPISVFAMLLEGRVNVALYSATPQHFEAGLMGILPMGKYHIITVEEDCSIVFLNILGDDPTFYQRILSHKSMQKIPQTNGLIHALPIIPTIQVFAEQIQNYILHNGDFYSDMNETKQLELQALLASNYSQEELSSMLSPLCFTHNSFYCEVIKLAKKILTTDEMAEELHMSRSAFLRHFSESFQLTPKQWSDNIRSIMLERALHNTSDSLSHIAQRLKFSSQQQMNAFCNNHLGASPMTIRTDSAKANTLN